MVTIPAVIPDTIPVELTVAIDVALLDQLPVVPVSVHVMVEPTQTVAAVYIMGGGVTGSGFTVTVKVAMPAEPAL